MSKGEVYQYKINYIFFVLIVETGLLLLRQLYGPIFGKLSLQFFMDLFDPE